MLPARRVRSVFAPNESPKALFPRFFKNGTFEQEVVQTYHSADMVVLAIMMPREVGGLQHTGGFASP